jgi:hypothetical protein
MQNAKKNRLFNNKFQFCIVDTSTAKSYTPFRYMDETGNDIYYLMLN